MNLLKSSIIGILLSVLPIKASEYKNLYVNDSTTYRSVADSSKIKTIDCHAFFNSSGVAAGFSCATLSSMGNP